MKLNELKNKIKELKEELLALEDELEKEIMKKNGYTNKVVINAFSNEAEVQQEYVAYFKSEEEAKKIIQTLKEKKPAFTGEEGDEVLRFNDLEDDRDWYLKNQEVTYTTNWDFDYSNPILK
jgi:hypothetical protein